MLDDIKNADDNNHVFHFSNLQVMEHELKLKHIYALEWVRLYGHNK